jgi:ABC-type phosphate transport system permease subunit
MSNPQQDPSAVPAPGHGWLIALATLLGTVLTPVAVWCAMLSYDHFDPMCGTGGEGGIACATRAFVVTLMAVLPGLLIGVVSGVYLASRRDRRSAARNARATEAC